MATVLRAFSAIAIAIACFGLLGIAALTFRQKTKEVSVRKVLGATRFSLMRMLVWDFTRVVLISILLAIPIVWWAMNRWLQNFTYRVGIDPMIFVLAGALLLVVAWGTLSYLTWSVSKINPAESLKNE